MALVLKDRVKVLATTTGTGAFTLGSAVTGFQDFSVIGDGNTTYYTIVAQATPDWEVGIGTYTASGTLLSRDTILESSNGGAAVDFPVGTKDVFVTYPAERATYLDTAGSYPVQNTFDTLNAANAVLTAGTVSTTPVNATDLVNKTYVDTAVSSGIHFHQPVRVESPINLNATYNNGTAGVGATLTNAGTQVALVIDGIAVSVADRVLVYEQTTQTQNGIYVVTDVGSGSTNWILTRSSDADTYAVASANGLGEGSAVFVQQGTTGAGETYVCNTPGTITFGTTNITFAQISSAQIYSAGTGLTLSGTQFSITNTGTAGTYGSASNVPVFTTNAQGQVTSVTDTAIAIAAGAVSGLAASATTDTTNASNITSGTLGTSRLSGSYTGITGVGTLAAGTWNGSTIDAVYGGTGLSSFVAGDIIYADSSTTLARLADVAVGNALISGGASADPSWGKIGLTTHVDGILPVANGGTGNATNQAASVANNATFNDGGAGAASGSTFNGSSPLTISYNTLGAYPTTNPAGYTSNTGTVTSVGGTGTVNGLTLTGTVTTSGNLTLGGTLSGIANAALANSSVTVNGTSIALGASGTITANTTSLLTFNNGGAGGASGTTFNGGSAITVSYNTVGAPSTTGTGASGSWNINAATATTATNQSGGTVNATTGTFSNQLLVNYNIASPVNYYNGLQQEIRATSGTAGIGLHRAGFSHCGIYHDATDTLKFNMNGGTVTLNASIGTVIGSGNFSTYAVPARTQSNWNDGTVINNVVGLLAWKNYGSSHTIFDASQSTTPSGTACSNTDSGAAWSATYPTLMGWNGVTTYGVRVDRARLADSASANLLLSGGNMSGLIATVGNTAAFTSANDTTLSIRSSGPSTAASMSFHRPGAYAINLGVDTDNIFKLGGWSAGGVQHYWDNGGNAFATSSMRAQLFYDLNNTAYYVDPASSSSLNQINGRSTSNLMFYEGFTLNADTMSTNATGFTYSVNAPYTGAIVKFSTGGGYDLQLNSTYGGTRLAYRNRNGDIGAWYPWSVVTTYDNNPGGDLYANRFYDAQNSGYYCDPAATSRLNVISLASTVGSGSWPMDITSVDRGIIFYNTSGSGIPLYFLVNSGATLSGYVVVSGGSTSYLTSSDYRMKENDVDINKDAALGKIMSLRPVTYDWKQQYGGEKGIGFIAHELQEVAPECVNGEKDAMMPDGKIMPQGVDTSFLIPTLCAAIQKQQELIEQLMAEVALLKGI